MTRIPIYFTFDNNYVNQAAVAFWTLLDRTRGGVFWEMWVLHRDITEEGRVLLQEIVAKKGNGSLTFVDVGDFLDEEWTGGNWGGGGGADTKPIHGGYACALLRRTVLPAVRQDHLFRRRCRLQG